jgi:2,4-dienoyl-CoA reductase-like NADH-dependent reductase (Old Yellow Enzyme family)
MSILFEPIAIHGMTLKNRFVRSATYDGMCQRNGHVSPEQIRLYEKLATGGLGLIVTGIAYVHASGKISPAQNSLAGDACIPGYQDLADAVHNRGGKIAVQLFHAGREVARTYPPKRKEAIAPSANPKDPYFEGPHRAMEEEEIWMIVRAFGEAARRARDAGVDAVQIHGAHAYLCSQFLSPFANRRTDRWGGALENRLRFHREIYRHVRSQVGDDYPVLIKIGVQDGFPEGLSFQEGKQAAVHLAGLGFDSLEISSGLRGRGYENAEFHTRVSRLEDEAYFRSWCREIKQQVQVPVMMVGGLKTFSLMEEVVQRGEADLVSLSRPLIREPGLVRDWETGDRHRARCISCNQCFEALVQGRPLACIQEEKKIKGEARGEGHTVQSGGKDHNER